MVMVANSKWREQARQWFRGSDRKILATLRDDFKGSGQPTIVFKIKEGGTLFLEFYSQDADRSLSPNAADLELLQRIELPNSIDGYVTFMGEATNLAVANLDGDPLLEILVPSYNLEFAPTLDVVKYNAGMGKFELMNSFEVPENLIQTIQKEVE